MKRKWIDILSVSYGASLIKNAQRRRGCAEFSDVSIVKAIDKSSPKIFESVLTGIFTANVTIDFCYIINGVAQTFFQLELTNVVINAASTSAQVGDFPLETVTFDFEEVVMKYFEYDAMGKVSNIVKTSWKVESENH